MSLRMAEEEIFRIVARQCSRQEDKNIDRVERLIAMLEVSEQLGSEAIRQLEVNPFELPDERLQEETGNRLQCAADVLKPAVDMLDGAEVGDFEVSEELFFLLRKTSEKETTIREEQLRFIKADLQLMRDDKEELVLLRDALVFECVLDNFPRIRALKGEQRG